MTQKGPIQLYKSQADLIWQEVHIQVVIISKKFRAPFSRSRRQKEKLRKVKKVRDCQVQTTGEHCQVQTTGEHCQVQTTGEHC
jgi:hypothetical protein